MPSAQAPPLAAHQRFASSDLDEVRDKVAQVYCSHRLDPVSGTGRLAAWQNSVALSRLAVGAMGYGADVVIDPGCLESFFLLMRPYGGSAAIDAGERSFVADRGTASLLNPTDPVRMIWRKDCAKLMVRIDRDAIQQQLAVLIDRPLRQPLRFDAVMAMDGRAATWWRYAGLLIEEIDMRGPAAPGSATVKQFESLLLTSILEIQPHNYTAALQDGGCRIAPGHVRRVEAYIEEHAHEIIDMAQLVMISGVSARTLFEGFQRFRDTSPMAYLKRIRMQRVRDDLLANPGTDTVANIAARWGFYELGRFAGEYRKLYAEMPSETLRRA